MPGPSICTIAEPAPKAGKTAFGLLPSPTDGRVTVFGIIRRHDPKHLGLIVEPIEEVLASIPFVCQKDSSACRMRQRTGGDLVPSVAGKQRCGNHDLSWLMNERMNLKSVK